jgi:hypothetical protein
MGRVKAISLAFKCVKPNYRYTSSCFCFLIISVTAVAQYNWKLSKDKDGIKVYESDIKNSNFKSIKVECDLEGDADKFFSVMNDVSHYKDWIYHAKTSYILKRISPFEFYYYEETFLPWPLSNRDAVLHLRIDKDSLGRFVNVNITSVPNYIPEKSGLVRVPHLLLNWTTNSISANALHHVYIFEIDPGGSLPAWLVNMFADKGPYETFRQLGVALKKQNNR